VAVVVVAAATAVAAAAGSPPFAPFKAIHTTPSPRRGFFYTRARTSCGQGCAVFRLYGYNGRPPKGFTTKTPRTPRNSLVVLVVQTEDRRGFVDGTGH